MIKIGNIILSLLTALMVVACSPGGGDIPSPGPYDDNSKPMDNISLNSFYEGVWMVNGIATETATVNVTVGNNDKLGLISAFDFPFQAITDLILPGATIGTIPNTVSIPIRNIGYSDNAFYFEFTSMYSSIWESQHIPYYVTLDDGKEVRISIHYVSERFSAIQDNRGESFSCIIPVDKIVCFEGTEEEMVEKEILLKPEMELKYTSTMRTKGSTVGN
jgi:hypothetical protein